MNKNIYILYDNKIETTESLEKFKKILVLAGFKDIDIQSISLDEYNEILIENNFYNFVIAINQTYKQINQIYSEKLDVPIFDFFSKEYINKEKNLVLYGLLFSVSSIYETAYKKFSWSVVQKFFSDYSKIINQQSDPSETCDYLSNDSYVSINEVEKEIDIQDVINTSVIYEEPEYLSETLQATPREELSYEELLSFYINAKNLISQFNKVQEQIRLIESNNETV